MQQTFEIPAARYHFGYAPIIYFVPLIHPICPKRLLECFQFWREYLFLDPTIEGTKHGVPCSGLLRHYYPQIYQDMLGEAQRLVEIAQGCVYSGLIPVLVDSQTRTRLDRKSMEAAMALSIMVAHTGRFDIPAQVGRNFAAWVKEKLKREHAARTQRAALADRDSEISMSDVPRRLPSQNAPE